MALYAVAFIASLLPSIGLFLWLRGFEEDDEFKGICNRDLIQGILTVFPVLGCSFVFAIIESSLSRLFGISGIPKAAFHDFIVVALSEELSKCYMFHRMLDKYQRAWSWADYVILTTLVHIGFGLAEDFPYAIGAGPIVMLVRGVTCQHGGYGFIMGYFLGKGKKSGNKKWTILGVLLPWLIHGSYDFGLSEEFSALGDNTAFLSVTLAGLGIVILLVLIVFFIRHKHDENFMAPMVPLPEPELEPDAEA